MYCRPAGARVFFHRSGPMTFSSERRSFEPSAVLSRHWRPRSRIWRDWKDWMITRAQWRRDSGKTYRRWVDQRAYRSEFKEIRMARKAKIERKTKETDIKLSLEIDGSGKAAIETGMPFLDHMLDSFSRHGFFDIDLKA